MIVSKTGNHLITEQYENMAGGGMISSKMMASVCSARGLPFLMYFQVVMGKTDLTWGI